MPSLEKDRLKSLDSFGDPGDGVDPGSVCRERETTIRYDRAPVNGDGEEWALNPFSDDAAFERPARIC